MKGEWTKTRKYRLVSNLPPNLWVWLWLYRQPSGPIIPMNYRNYRKVCAVARGSQDWPKNAFRHSSRYKGRVAEAAVEYFGILPE
jgi:hypothetical protein